MVANEEKLALVGRFVKEIPHLDTIRRTICASLRLEGGVKVASLNRRTILLRFDLEFDCRKIWLRRAMLEGARVWISLWTPDSNARRDSLVSLVWFQLSTPSPALSFV
nr:uncharacterized protein LOC109159462 [Ipomoea batatas]